MMIRKIKKFDEAISGTELIGHMGPNYGDQKLHVGLSTSQTEVLYSELDDKVYTYDDFQSKYQEYLKCGGKPLVDGFTKKNLDIVVSQVSKSIVESLGTPDAIMPYADKIIKKCESIVRSYLKRRRRYNYSEKIIITDGDLKISQKDKSLFPVKKLILNFKISSVSVMPKNYSEEYGSIKPYVGGFCFNNSKENTVDMEIFCKILRDDNINVDDLIFRISEVTYHELQHAFDRFVYPGFQNKSKYSIFYITDSFEAFKISPSLYRFISCLYMTDELEIRARSSQDPKISRESFENRKSYKNAKMMMDFDYQKCYKESSDTLTSLYSKDFCEEFNSNFGKILHNFMKNCVDKGIMNKIPKEYIKCKDYNMIETMKFWEPIIKSQGLFLFKKISKKIISN